MRRIFASEPDLQSSPRSVTWQSLVVAVIAAAVDVTYIVVSGIFADAPVAAAAVVILMTAADLALAAPPSTVAAVAVLQAVTRVIACLLLYSHGRAAGLRDIGIVVAGYRTGAWLSNRTSAVIIPVMIVSAACACVLNSAYANDWRILLAISASNGIVPWLVGRYTAVGGRHVFELKQRARLRQQEHRLAMAEALADEREAIARDLHDVISHHVSAMAIHAGAARMALTDSQPEVTRSLSAVEASSRAAMVDLRRQLDLLHGRQDAEDRQAGLANIDELIDSVRNAGLDVDLDVPADPPALPQSVDITVFRIVQELLTNALRHGDGAARLNVQQHVDQLVIIESNAVAAEPYSGDSLHRGLDGIRRRAELFGGTVECGVDDEDQWRTVVFLPIGAS